MNGDQVTRLVLAGLRLGASGTPVGAAIAALDAAGIDSFEDVQGLLRAHGATDESFLRQADADMRDLREIIDRSDSA